MRKYFSSLLPDREDLVLLAIFTRHWIHYGAIVFVVILAVTAAVEGLLAR